MTSHCFIYNMTLLSKYVPLAGIVVRGYNDKGAGLGQRDGRADDGPCWWAHRPDILCRLRCDKGRTPLLGVHALLTVIINDRLSRAVRTR